MVVRMLGPSDADLVIAAGAEVFDNAPDPDLTAEFLADPRHHMAAAFVAGRIVGMASAFHYIHPDKPPEMWINEVGVADAFQRRGIATKLMSTLLDHGSKLGCCAAWLMTETDNVAARGLYSTIGGKEETVVYFSLEI